MPSNLPRQSRRLLHQLLRIILSEMAVLRLIIQRQDIRGGLQLRDCYDSHLCLGMSSMERFADRMGCGRDGMERGTGQPTYIPARSNLAHARAHGL